MWFSLFRKVEVTDKIYKKFIDTGKAPEKVIRLLAFKIMKNEELNKKEMAVFFGMTSEVNQMIVALSKKSI